MANWLIAVDSDEDRRARYLASVQESVCPFESLKTGIEEGADWGIVWAAGKSAPVDADFGPTGGAIVWGEPRDRSGGLLTALQVNIAWADGATAQWDGFFSAVTVDEDGRSVTVGTDLLGLYPVYYWSNGQGVSLVGTSPQLFRAHSSFTAEIDMNSLIGILLTNGILDNRALWKGVHRLAPGNRVRIRNGECNEDINYRVPVECETRDMPFRGHVRQLDDSLRAAMARHVPDNRNYSLMLSGGLDSRLLAGYLADQRSSVQCITFGKYRDFEMRSARAVARAVGFRQVATEIPDAGYARAAARLAHWELLGAGFSGVPEWAMYGTLFGLPDRLVLGHSFDGIVGGIHIGWAYDTNTGRMDLDVLLPTILAWGLQPNALKRLVGPDNEIRVDRALARIRSIYNGLAPREHHRAWLFDLQHRQRLHVGSAMWPLSFMSWPTAPFLDQDVLSVCAAMPSSSIADRRAQFGLLSRSFPKLASLPLDRNSWDDMPPTPGLKDFLRRSLNYRLHAVQRKVRHLIGREMPDRVYYHRLYNLNAPGWRSVRELSEPSRSALRTLLVAEEIDSILPAPDDEVRYHNVVKDPSAARMLMGLGLTLTDMDST